MADPTDTLPDPTSPDLAPDAPPPDAAPDAPPADAPEAPPWEGKTPEELWQLNDKLREENVKYKERFRPYEDALGDLAPEDTQFFTGFIQALKAGNAEAVGYYAPTMRELLDKMSPAQQQAVADAVEQAQEEFDPFDTSQVDKRIEDRAKALLDEHTAAQQREREVAEASKAMADHATKLATDLEIPALGDPTSGLHRLLYISAHNDFPETKDILEKLTKAGEKIRDDLLREGQALLRAKGADAAPSPVPPDGAAPSGRKEPLTLDDAAKAARERIDQAFLGQPGT